MAIEKNEVNLNSKGGTEQMMARLEEGLSPALLDKFQIFFSRVKTALDPDKKKILYCHDLPEDPESQHLKNGGWDKFDALVFVSHWQRQRYVDYYKIPLSRTVVMKNAITPINIENALPAPPVKQTTNIIYHTTPHRGLELLYPVFEHLFKTDTSLSLDVYSSFELYGWGERDKQYEQLYAKLNEHPGITYHGAKPNDVVRAALVQADIFAYPSIWPETSCLALIEAMSAGCMCVHPDLAALAETGSNYTSMYAFDENPNKHINTFTAVLSAAIEAVKHGGDGLRHHLAAQKSYVDLFYNWPDVRARQWQAFLTYMSEIPSVAGTAAAAAAALSTKAPANFTYRTI